MINLKDLNKRQYGTIIVILIIIAFFVSLATVLLPPECKSILISDSGKINDRSLSGSEIKRPNTQNAVILRIDDIQAWVWRNISIKMMDDALARNMTLVAGVIPRRLGKDRILVDYLKGHRDEIEISLHGWNHSPHEFQNLTEKGSYKKISRGKHLLMEETGVKKIYSFIPPYGEFSRGTLSATERADIAVLSGIRDRYFDSSISAYSYENISPTPISRIEKVCKEHFSAGKPCIILLHPQDYADENHSLDKEKYDRYLELLSMIGSMNAETTNFKNLVRCYNRNESY